MRCWLSFFPTCSQEIGLVNVVAQAYADVKPSARRFLDMNGEATAHIFGKVDEMVAGISNNTRIPCLRHGACRVNEKQPEGNLFVIGGFPCSPFSNQRCGRHNAGRPTVQREVSRGHTGRETIPLVQEVLKISHCSPSFLGNPVRETALQANVVFWIIPPSLPCPLSLVPAAGKLTETRLRCGRY